MWYTVRRNIVVNVSPSSVRSVAPDGAFLYPLPCPAAYGRIWVKGGEIMISNEKLTFLRWLREQPKPVDKHTIISSAAPCFNSQRLDELYKEGYVNRTVAVLSRNQVGVYAISDKGRAALQNEEYRIHEKRVETIRYIITTAIAVVALFLSIISIAMQLSQAG